MKRVAGALVLVMVLGTGCRGGGDGAPAGPGGGADQEMSQVESTLDAIESEMAGD